MKTNEETIDLKNCKIEQNRITAFGDITDYMEESNILDDAIRKVYAKSIIRKKYICIAPNKEQFNIKGESLGMSGERALYFAKNIGKHRIYRSSYPLEPYYFHNENINENLTLFSFDNKEKAQKLCDEINKAYGDDFIVKEIRRVNR